jgi:hypothetical protein
MTADDTTGSAAADPGALRLSPEAPAIAPAEVPIRPMPRLGRGIVWSDVVAEIERDNSVRTRDAA